MSTAEITVQTPGGPVTMPLAQMMAIAECLIAADRGRPGLPGAVWHAANCGCCYVVHRLPEPGEEPAEGWVIGSDGGFTYYGPDGSERET